MHSKLIFWFVSLMVRWVASTYSPAVQPEAERVRFEAIAADAVAVAFDPTEKPLFQGPLGRTKTAMLLLSVASFESRFEADVESGVRRGDSGRSWCLMQINIGSGRIALDGDGYKYPKGTEGWAGKDLVGEKNRPDCFRIALHIARKSYQGCGNLSVYTSGRCDKESRAARYRETRAKVSFQSEVSKVTWRDSDISETLALTP